MVCSGVRWGHFSVPLFVQLAPSNMNQDSLIVLTNLQTYTQRLYRYQMIWALMPYWWFQSAVRFARGSTAQGVWFHPICALPLQPCTRCHFGIGCTRSVRDPVKRKAVCKLCRPCLYAIPTPRTSKCTTSCPNQLDSDNGLACCHSSMF